MRGLQWTAAPACAPACPEPPPNSSDHACCSRWPPAWPCWPRLAATSSGDLAGQISATRSATSSLRSQITADSQQIAATSDGLAQARARLAVVQADLDRRVAELRTVQSQLLAARARLVALENRLHAATTALAANLVAGYEGSQPNLVSVILNAHGFGQLLEQVNFMTRMAHQDSRVVGVTRTARAEVARDASALASLEARDRKLADAVVARRNQAAALQVRPAAASSCARWPGARRSAPGTRR